MEIIGWLVLVTPFAWLYFRLRSAQSGDRRYPNGPDIGAPGDGPGHF